MNCIKTSAER